MITPVVCRTLLSAVVVCLLAKADVLAKSCLGAECKYLVVARDQIFVGYSPDPAMGHLQGSYLPKLQGLVSSDQGPFWAGETPGGWKVILAWGFEEGKYRPAGPTFFIYFFKGDRLISKAVGDIKLERIELGRLFGTKSEFLAISMQSETAVSILTEVWRLPPRGVPQMVLQLGGHLDGILESRKGGPALEMSTTLPGERHSDDRWVPEVWRWEERRRRFSVQRR